MTSPELRATIIERDRLALELRRCDVHIADAMWARDSVAWTYWARRRESAWTRIAELNVQAAALA